MSEADRISTWMRGQVTSAGAQGIVVGLSGGIDSAVVMRLAQLAVPQAVVGVVMPCHSDAADERDAMAVATQFSVPVIRVDLAPTFDLLSGTLRGAMGALPASIHTQRPHDDPRSRMPLANLKPRLRMTTVYYVANTLNYLVAGTGNRSELAVGYFTKYGDGGVDMLPIANLVKREVRALGRELGLPDDIVNRTPSAGLWLGQTDESEMGFSYDQLEKYLTRGPDAVEPALAEKIGRLARASEHKRRMPPAP